LRWRLREYRCFLGNDDDDDDDDDVNCKPIVGGGEILVVIKGSFLRDIVEAGAGRE